jgi:hypothetical protein
MSQWTHVNGSIRIDSLRIVGAPMPGLPMTVSDIEERLGRVVRFDDSEWETTVPCGSEGSLEYTVTENPDKHHLAAFTVNIWGDLRDYGSGDVHEIEEWLNKVVKDWMIRDLVVNVDVEFSGERIIFVNSHDKSTNGSVKIKKIVIKEDEDAKV